jgi:hypothetical protein
MKNQSKDRVIINIIPFGIGLAVALLTSLFVTGEISLQLEKIVSSMLEVWGILLGFMIAAVSVLLSFNDGKYITLLKESGHYKTVLLAFIYCCFHLLVSLIFAMTLLLYQFNTPILFNLLCGLAADTIVIVGECLYFLLYIVVKVE